MGFSNPPVPWREVERALSDRAVDQRGAGPVVPGRNGATPGDGGDSPAWSRKRHEFIPPALPTSTADAVPYAELHVHSNASFLDGASHPEELAIRGAELGLDALAITDHDGMYGVVRFAEAARSLELATVFGAELSLELDAPQTGVPDPMGAHLLVVARGADGYARLSRAISDGQRTGGMKGRPTYDLEQLAATAAGQWLVLTGCRKGAVPQALLGNDPSAARAELDRLVTLFGRDNVAVELHRFDIPTDDEWCDALTALAHHANLPIVATGNVHYASPNRARLAAALAAVRARSGLDDMDGWLPSAGTAYLRSGAEMARRFARYPGAVATAARLGAECSFDLALVAPGLPPFPVPEGHTEASYLRELVWAGALDRYGPRDHERVPGAYVRLERELAMIEQLGFSGYFLIVWEIAKFCHDNRILCQGRGSAATSAVCYTLKITTVDAVYHDLLFERFLSPEREEGYPDIDLDISSARREEAIQHVYQRYGRRCAAQVANVITYRARSAVRDMARALGYSQGQQDAWSKQVDRWSGYTDGDHDIPAAVLDLAEQVRDFPRHLGIHSGGMVICDRPIIDVCPVEWATMPDRTVLQWDKDDCASVGLVKFDLLGLGMLTALQHTHDLVLEHHGVDLDLGRIPPEDPAVYDMLCVADSVGVFQVESRAQMATLPRLKPRTFYDLVIEVALIRPGPIQGGSVHPYLRRRNGTEPADPPHPLLTKTLERTLGVPLFQEQLMQMAVDLSDFTAAEADGLRRAMSSKRSIARMKALEERLLRGMADKGVDPAVAQRLFEKLLAFANYGFPESHSISFAQIVYTSSWFKRYFPAAFCAGLLRSQPMGFYSPQSLVADARRHGVTTNGPDINHSSATAGLEPIGLKSPAARLAANGGCPPVSADWSAPVVPPGLEYLDLVAGDHLGQPSAVRLGLDAVRTLSTQTADAIAYDRSNNGPYTDLADVVRRVHLSERDAEVLASAGAFDSLGVSRREALWAAGAIAREQRHALPVDSPGIRAPALPGMTEVERTIADLWSTGVTPDGYPTELLRERLTARGILTTAALKTTEAQQRIWIGGIVTHRQRPATAGGVTFVNLEDETGMANVICSPGVWKKYRRVARCAAAMLVRGMLERNDDGVVNLLADRIEILPMPGPTDLVRSRDFR